MLRGHAAHFRCEAAAAQGIRVHVMSRMRGAAGFDELWSRRTSVDDDANLRIELMSLPILVTVKKTQCDTDWPMIRRLVEANYAQHREAPTGEQLQFWLLESRTPDMLIELASRFPEAAESNVKLQSLLTDAKEDSRQKLIYALAEEQEAEREVDRIDWVPLKRELEKLRQPRR